MEAIPEFLQARPGFPEDLFLDVWVGGRVEILPPSWNEVRCDDNSEDGGEEKDREIAS
jgi:hypothetical protein